MFLLFTLDCNGTNKLTFGMDVLENSLILTDLPLNCLLEVFEYFDLDELIRLTNVCQLFRDIVHRHSFPRVKEFECCLYCEGEPRASNKISLIGPYLKRFNFKSFNIFVENDYISFLQHCAVNIGTNIREMTLIVEDFPAHLMNILGPILANLESLKICTNTHQSQVDLDFRTACPNLLHFYMGINMKFESSSGKWPKLQSLALGDSSLEAVNESTLLQFMSNNPQLKALKISARNDTWRISDIVHRLPNLEQLTIMHDGGNFHNDLHLLSELKFLRELKIMRILGQYFDAIVNVVPNCSRLQHLSLQTCNRPRLSFVSYSYPISFLGQMLADLESFEISDCKLSETDILGFIKRAAKLKELHLHNCQIEITESFLASAIKLRAKFTAEPLRICDDKELMMEVSELKLKLKAQGCRAIQIFNCKECDISWLDGVGNYC